MENDFCSSEASFLYLTYIPLYKVILKDEHALLGYEEEQHDRDLYNHLYIVSHILNLFFYELMLADFESYIYVLLHFFFLETFYIN